MLKSTSLGNEKGITLIAAVVGVAVLGVTIMVCLQSIPFLTNRTQINHENNELQSSLNVDSLVISNAINQAGGLSPFIRNIIGQPTALDPVVTVNINTAANFVAEFGFAQTSTVTVGGLPFTRTYTLTLMKSSPGAAGVPIVINTDTLSQVAYLLVQISLQGAEATGAATQTTTYETAISVQYTPLSPPTHNPLVAPELLPRITREALYAYQPTRL